MSTMAHHETHTNQVLVNNSPLSDHDLLLTTLCAARTPRIHCGRTKPVLKVQSKLSDAQLLQIIQHESWPEQPFIEVAKLLNLAKTCHVAKDPLINFRKALKAAENDHDNNYNRASFIELLQNDLEDELEHRAKKSTLNP